MTANTLTSDPAAPVRTRRAVLGILGGLVLVGAVLRFATLGDQSLWFDEGLTRDLVLKPFGDMLDAIAETEANPPLFYALIHLVTQVVAPNEVGLRLVSAIAGTLAIPLAFLAGRDLNGERAGLFAAALVAVNPLLFWFSQEARAYSLLALLSGLAFVCFLRAIASPSRWALAGWAMSSVAAVATHYFAVFPLLAEAAWMVATLTTPAQRRGVLAAVLVAAAALAAIAPLAISQAAGAEHLAAEALARRIAQIPKQLLVGYDGPAQDLLAVLSLALVAAAAVGLWRIRDRRQVLAAVAVAASAIVVPVAAAVVGVDFLNTRNVLPGLIPVLALVGAGFAALPRLWGLLGAAALVTIGLVTAIAVSATPGYQRADWRSLDEAVGQSAETRLLAVSPDRAEVPLGAYREGIAPAGPDPVRVREVLLAGVAIKSGAGENAVPPRPEPPALPGFTLTERDLAETYTLYRYRAERPTEVRADSLAQSALSPPASVLVVPGG